MIMGIFLLYDTSVDEFRIIFNYLTFHLHNHFLLNSILPVTSLIRL